MKLEKTVRPTLTGRCLLAFYKGRWCFLALIPIWAYVSLVVICGLRMQEEGLRYRMLAAVEMIANPPATIEDLDRLLAQHKAKIQPSDDRTESENRAILFDLLTQWRKLAQHEYPGKHLSQIAAFLSPATNGRPGVEPPVTVETPLDAKGDYRRYQIDLRVDQFGYSKVSQAVEDALWLKGTAQRWEATRFFLSDQRTTFWPADEYRFYDYKRDRLNRIILGGIVCSLGVLALLTGASLGGFDPPTWAQIFTAREFVLCGQGRSATPFDADPGATRLSAWWLLPLGAMVVAIQIFQCLERKELWAEGWINHPASFIVISSFWLALVLSFRRLTPATDREYFLDDYLNHFRQHNLSLLCIPVAALIVILFSYLTLWDLDRGRAVVQIAVSTAFLTLTALSFRHMARAALPVECRRNKDAGPAEKVRLRDHVIYLFLPRFDHTLPLQMLTMVGGILVFVTVGGV